MQVASVGLPARLRRCTPALPRSQSPVLGFAARSSPCRHLSLSVQASKGFGKQKPAPANADDERKRKGKAKRVQLQPGSVGPIPNQQRQQQSDDPIQAQFSTKLLEPDKQSEEEDEFMARLQALKEQGKERAAAAASASSADGAAAALAATPAIFDAVPTSAVDGGGNIYANPPPVSQTLLAAAGGGVSDISDPKLRDANIGPSQLGLAAGAIVFIAIFVIVAAGDYAPSSRRYSGIRPAQAPPDPIEEKILKGKIALYEDQLKADPNNDDATEALATSYARMLQYDKAAGLLERLSKRNPNDAEVWRLLGESSLLSQQPRKAVPAFERAVELRRQQQQQQAGFAGAASGGVITQPDLQLLTGLVDAFIANNDYSKAIDALRTVREELRSKSSQQKVVVREAAVPREAAAPAAVVAEETAAAAVAAVQGAELEEAVAAATEVAATAAPLAAASGVAAEAETAALEPQMLAAPPLTDDAPSTSGVQAPPLPQQQQQVVQQAVAAAPASMAAAIRPLDPVGVELLTAKVYSAWRGHDQDALATYDELIKTFPEDYRGYLAKGVFLKEKGRKADAERMFLQARFFAPASKQQLVKAIADFTPAVPQLPDSN